MPSSSLLEYQVLMQYADRFHNKSGCSKHPDAQNKEERKLQGAGLKFG